MLKWTKRDEFTGRYFLEILVGFLTCIMITQIIWMQHSWIFEKITISWWIGKNYLRKSTTDVYRHNCKHAQYLYTVKRADIIWWRKIYYNSIIHYCPLIYKYAFFVSVYTSVIESRPQEIDLCLNFSFKFINSKMCQKMFWKCYEEDKSSITLVRERQSCNLNLNVND